MRASRRAFLDCGGCAVMGLLAHGLPSGRLAELPMDWLDGRPDRADRRYPIPTADGVTVDRTAQVIVVREAGYAYVFNLACPHEQAAVKWVAHDHRFQCTKHDSRYQATGIHVAGRATRNLDRFAVRRDGAALVVDLTQYFRSDTDPARWASAAVAL